MPLGDTSDGRHYRALERLQTARDSGQERHELRKRSQKTGECTEKQTHIQYV